MSKNSSVNIENGLKLVSDDIQEEDRVIIVLRETDGFMYWELNPDVTLDELIRFYRIMEDMKVKGDAMYIEIPTLMDDAILTVQTEIERIILEDV